MSKEESEIVGWLIFIGFIFWMATMHRQIEYTQTKHMIPKGLIKFPEWTKICDLRGYGSWYVDFKTAKFDGVYKYAWVMASFEQPLTGGRYGDTGSILSYIQYDCLRTKRRFRGLRIVAYSEAMGKGEILGRAEHPDSWSHEGSDQVSPGSGSALLLDVICAAKIPREENAN